MKSLNNKSIKFWQEEIVLNKSRTAPLIINYPLKSLELVLK